MSGPYFSDRATPDDRTWDKKRRIGRYEAEILRADLLVTDHPTPILSMLVRHLERNLGHEMMFSDWDIVKEIMYDFKCSSAQELMSKKIIVYTSTPLEARIATGPLQQFYEENKFYAFGIGGRS